MRTDLYTISLLLICSLTAGCGYTTGSLLPEHLKTIYVENFTNNIVLTDETSDKRVYKTYRPRLEVDVTQAIIDKYIFDGHLKIVHKEDADMILEGALVDFRREPTRYGDDDNVEQYRIVIIVDMKITDVKNSKTMWHESSFAGNDYYYTTGSQAKSEAQAITDALEDLARRVVERTIEVW